MFETQFSYRAVRRRHEQAPLASERAVYLEGLASKGLARSTVLQRAVYCLRSAEELENWPQKHLFSEADVEKLASTWAASRVNSGQASSPKWPLQNFRTATSDFLGAIGRLAPKLVSEPGPHDDRLEEFLAEQQRRGWQSPATVSSGRWQIERFLTFLEDKGLVLETVTAEDVDVYFQDVGLKWSRVSLAMTAKFLRAWFRHCESKGWVSFSVADAIIAPRIYRQEGLPLGPTWKEVSAMVTNAEGDSPALLRDRAILLLLCIYGIRSGEVRRLRIEDLDWQADQIRFVRSKSLRQDTFPLEPSVGFAIARYLKDGRPRSEEKTLFLTLRAPFRSLSPGGLYNVVRRHLPPDASPSRGFGPHGLRHACARHLLECGLSFKEVGDHLGHRSPEATRVYAKVDLASLRLVAFEDLGGLA